MSAIDRTSQDEEGFALGTFDAEKESKPRKGRRKSIEERLGGGFTDITFSVNLGQNEIVKNVSGDEDNAKVDGLIGDYATFEPASPTKRATEKEATLQRRIFILLDEPDSSPPAALIGFGILVLILLSTVCFVAETTEYVKTRQSVQDTMGAVEIVCIISFTVEYLVKVACCTHRLTPNPTVITYVRKPMNLVDLFAILPFYIELLLGATLKTEVLRALRMTRVFRILKVGNFSNDLQLFTDGMARAKEGLLLLLFMLSLYLCIFGTILWMVEYDAQQQCVECAAAGYGCSCPSKLGFTSVPTCWYFIIATLTTVGYGDQYPITVEGKLVTGGLMLCGLLVLGLPIVVIGSSFQDAFTDREITMRNKAIARDRKRKAADGIDPVTRPPPPLHRLMAIESKVDGFSTLASIRMAAALLDQQYGKTGDKRFFSAKEALTYGLDEDMLNYRLGLT